MHKATLLIVVSLFVIPIALVHGQTVAGTDFILTSPTGYTTARLTTSGEGTPALFFYDKKNVVRISIGLYEDGAPGVVLNDEAGKAAAIMRLVESAGNPVLVLKENGQDKLIIDKSGMPETPALPLVIIIGFIAGVIGGVIATRLLPVKIAVPTVV